MKIPNVAIFYYWDNYYTKRNLHKVIRENYDSYTTYVLNSYNEWEFDDNVSSNTLLMNEDARVFVEYDDSIAVLSEDDLK